LPLIDPRGAERYCGIMKNVTVSLDDSTYRAARIKAAEAGRSLSALVREFLQQLGSGESEFERLHREEIELRKKLTLEARGFRAGDRMSREEVHDRALARREHEEAERRRA
jgi:plasmid stability protein